MAKKHKTSAKRKASSTKSKTMSTPRKRKKKKALSASPRRRRSLPVSVTTTVRRRKKKGMLAASGSEIKANLSNNGIAVLGGAAYGIGSHFMKGVNPWIKAGTGAVLSFGMGLINLRNLAAGAAGATGSELMQNLMSQIPMLNDGEMNDTEWVDPSTLSDSGMDDDNGNPIVMDKDGMCYMKDGENSYQAIGDAMSLSQGVNLNNVSMVPLQEGMSNNPYNLSANAQYALASNY